MTINVLYVPYESSERVEVRKASTLKDYQAMVGGLIESIAMPGCSCFGHDEAKLAEDWLRTINHRGNTLARALKWPGVGVDILAGNLVFLGIPDGDGNETEVPDYILALAERVGVLSDV